MSSVYFEVQPLAGLVMSYRPVRDCQRQPLSPNDKLPWMTCVDDGRCVTATAFRLCSWPRDTLQPPAGPGTADVGGRSSRSQRHAQCVGKDGRHFGTVVTVTEGLTCIIEVP